MFRLRAPVRWPCSRNAATVPTGWLTSPRRFSQHHQPPHHDHVSAVVVGAGPAGIATVGNVLDVLGGRGRVAWVDPSFSGGRVNARWREVPSNTTVKLFLEYGRALDSFRRVAQKTPQPNALTTLEHLDPNATCSLHHAGDMLQQLSDGLRREEDRVTACEGVVVRTARANAAATAPGWTVTVRGNDSSSMTGSLITAPLVIFCTGSSPTTVELPTTPSVTPHKLLSLETALAPSILADALPRDRALCVGVVGASHSAVLALMNLVGLGRTTHPRLRVHWFSRTPTLKYAEYRDGWILYDNTGLKGSAADFGRRFLDGEALSSAESGGVGDIVTRVDCSGGPEREREAFLRHLPGCDYVVQAVGFTRDALPEVEGGIDVDYDDTTGGLVRRDTREPLPGLFGAGIAFPERVTDPLGNQEHAVGFYKFMKFLKRVVPEWVKGSQYK